MYKYSLPCPGGRLQTAGLAAMNLRAVIEPATLTYVSVPPSKPVQVTTAVPAKYRPRNANGQFARYAELLEAINVDCAFTNFEFDQRDEGTTPEEPNEPDGWDDFDDPFDFFDIA